MTIEVKICGINDEEALEAAVVHGADMIGFVFYPDSPRNVSIERAAELAFYLPEDIKTVGLFVNPEDRLLDQVMNAIHLDLFQLHGQESPDRVEAIRFEYGMPVMKALSIADKADLDRAKAWRDVADRLLFDAKPPKDATLPGGNGVSFDCSLLSGFEIGIPWMLAGGLTPENVAQAIKISGARAVDVSSGVESAPGCKDPNKIEAFLKACGV